MTKDEYWQAIEDSYASASLAYYTRRASVLETEAAGRFAFAMDELSAYWNEYLDSIPPEDMARAAALMEQHPEWGWLDALADLERSDSRARSWWRGVIRFLAGNPS